MSIIGLWRCIKPHTGQPYLLPYPLRAARISVSFGLHICWVPVFYHNKKLTEWAKEQGSIIWSVRWLFIHVDFSRWL